MNIYKSKFSKLNYIYFIKGSNIYVTAYEKKYRDLYATNDIEKIRLKARLVLYSFNDAPDELKQHFIVNNI